MLDTLIIRARHILRVAIAFVPWLIAMYLFYWLNYSENWTSETGHRGKLSVVILAVGMGVSFLVHSYFVGRERK